MKYSMLDGLERGHMCTEEFMELSEAGLMEGEEEWTLSGSQGLIQKGGTRNRRDGVGGSHTLDLLHGPQGTRH